MRDFNVDGVVVGRPYQEVHEQSATQESPIGSIHERHGRRWRYCKAGASTFLFAHRGHPNMNIIPGDTGGSTYGVEGNLYEAAIAGADNVLVTTTTAFTLDFFTGGLFVVFSTGLNPDLFCLRVSGNDVGNGTYVKVYLDERLPVAVTVAFGVNLHPSPYGNIGTSQQAAGGAQVVCVPSIKATANYYFWGQTKGPCWVTPTTWSGNAGHLYVFNGSDGCLIPDTGANPSLQLAGHVLARNVTDYGDGIIQLMLE